MELVNIKIFYFLFLCSVVGCVPKCISYHDRKEDVTHEMQHEIIICSIKPTACSDDAFVLQQTDYWTEPEVKVCLSEEQATCILTWTIDDAQGMSTNLFMTLAVNEFDISSISRSFVQCYNVSMERVNTPASVTVLLELQPHEGFTALRSSVIQHRGLEKPSTLTGNTVLRNGKDSTCNPKDPCLVSPTVNVREVICHGDTAYVWVETSVLGVATRLIELQVGDDSRSCSGTKYGNCTIHFNKTYGGRTQLKIRVILADGEICEFTTVLAVRICGDPQPEDGSLSVFELNTNATGSAVFSRVPHVFIVVYVSAIAVSLTVLITTVFAIYNRLKNTDCTRRQEPIAQNNEQTITETGEANSEKSADTETVLIRRTDERHTKKLVSDRNPEDTFKNELRNRLDQMILRKANDLG